MAMLKTPDTDTGQVAVTMACALGFGALVVTAALWSRGNVWSGLLWAGAWSAVGWFIGFLFGIPRYLSTDTARTPASPALDGARKKLGDAEAAAERARSEAQAAAKATGESTRVQEGGAAAGEAEAALQRAREEVASATAKANEASGPSTTVNTNLEQISDWLTKIIVGVSLVESQTLLQKMQGAAAYMARSMVKLDAVMPLPLAAPDALAASGAASAGASAVVSAVSASAPPAAASGMAMLPLPAVSALYSTESFAYAVMLYFLATGLLGSYLLTRLFLQRAFDEAAASRDKALQT